MIDKWAELIHELKQQIEKWERIGQGYGGYFDDDVYAPAFDEDDNEGERMPAPKFGELHSCSQGALDSRSLFFRDR